MEEPVKKSTKKRIKKPSLELEVQESLSPKLEKLGHTFLKKGESLWKYNPIDNKLEQVKADYIDINGEMSKNKTVLIDKTCLYTKALNRENALRKLRNNFKINI